jgi:hypothetical protein
MPTVDRPNRRHETLKKQHSPTVQTVQTVKHLPFLATPTNHRSDEVQDDHPPLVLSMETARPKSGGVLVRALARADLLEPATVTTESPPRPSMERTILATAPRQRRA